MNSSRPFFITVSAVSALAVLALVGCSDKAAIPAAAAAAPATSAAAGTPASTASAAAPPVSVSVVHAVQRDMAVKLNATGTVVPLTSVDVRSQVTSTIRQVHFKEGQFVKAGQLLFTLDARADEANVAKARAQLAKDQASLAEARRQWERSKQLLAQNFVSQGAVDTAQAQVDTWIATVAADQAAIAASNVALSYGRITAPNSGRAGAVNVFAGSAVLANQTALVTITQLDPIGVAYSISQRDLSNALTALQGGGAKVTATLADGGGTFEGRLQFLDNLVDASSGTVKAKAVFANPASKLWPGAFVEVQQTVTTLKDAVVLPQASIIQGPRGTIVYVVEGGVAQPRPVKLLHAEAGEAAVSGVQPGEVVVMDGRQNLRPQARVVVRAPAAAASAAGKGQGKGGGNNTPAKTASQP